MANKRKNSKDYTSHNIRFMRDADHEAAEKHVSKRAKEWFSRPAYGSIGWWHDADRKESEESE